MIILLFTIRKVYAHKGEDIKKVKLDPGKS